MKLHHARRLIGLAGLGSLLATSAIAQDSYYYGGVSAGESRGKFDEQRITNSVIGGGLATTGITRDSKDTAYRLFGGYQMNRNFGVELGYFDLGKFGFSSSTVPAGRLDGQIRFQGGSLDLVGAFPFGESWSALARLGGFYAKTRDQFDGSGAVAVTNSSPSKREANVKVGLGMQYALGRSLLLRGEAERYRVSDAVDGHGHINVYSVGLVMPFGRGGSSTPRAMATPAYQPPVAMAPAPMPAPMPTVAPRPEPVAAPAAAPEPVVIVVPVVPVTVPAPRQRVSFAAESLFGFDAATLRPEGKKALDQFAQSIVDTEFTMITVEGHTDRLGTNEYNQALSTQRADAVKAYLVTSGHIDPMKITAVGKSETDPTTKPGDCQGRVANAKLIACLQPDRRVDIEVTAMR